MWEFDFTPICTILAGPNGSGKSSAAQLWLNVPGEVVNTDVVARLINPDKPEAASVARNRPLARLSTSGKAAVDQSFSKPGMTTEKSWRRSERLAAPSTFGSIWEATSSST